MADNSYNCNKRLELYISENLGECDFHLIYDWLHLFHKSIHVFLAQQERERLWVNNNLYK